MPDLYRWLLLGQMREELDIVGVPNRPQLRGNEENPFEKVCSGEVSMQLIEININCLIYGLRTF